MSFYITSDNHGTLEISKILNFFNTPEANTPETNTPEAYITEFNYTKPSIPFTPDDYLIILGDVGVCAFTARDSEETRQALRSLPVTVLFVDGNHENFAELNSYAEEPWNGGKVHFVEDNIIHLMRGQVFDIDGTTFFTMGGGTSIDKARRQEGIDWFPEELPSEAELEEGLANLEAYDYTVDYMLSHTGPKEVTAAMGKGDFFGEDEWPLQQYLQRLADHVDFTHWYFGHFHTDETIDDTFTCVFNQVIKL